MIKLKCKIYLEKYELLGTRGRLPSKGAGQLTVSWVDNCVPSEYVSQRTCQDWQLSSNCTFSTWYLHRTSGIPCDYEQGTHTQFIELIGVIVQYNCYCASSGRLRNHRKVPIKWSTRRTNAAAAMAAFCLAPTMKGGRCDCHCSFIVPIAMYTTSRASMYQMDPCQWMSNGTCTVKHSNIHTVADQSN